MITGAVHIRDTDTPALRMLAARVQRPRALMAVAGKRVEKELRSHFSDKDRQGNAQGWPRSHFWNRAVRSSTAFQGATDTSAEVAIAAPEFMQKLRGGRISAKRGKFLAKPLTARAKAAGSPREGGWRGGTLTFIRLPDGRALLVEALHTRLSFRRGRAVGGKEAGGEAQYILLRSVNQKPDATALPPDKAINDAIDDEAEKFFTRERLRV